MTNTLEKKRRAYLFLKALAEVLTVVTIVILVVGMAYIVFQIRSSQLNNRKVTELIADCTTPGGKCYEEGQSSTNKAVTSISQVVIATKICSLDPKNNTIDALTVCVRKAVGG